ncbi:glycosyltransferase [Vibrio splendidus]|nr:glycosyltransferase [Vibrio splendidus]PTP95827.1 hypothetical protein CWO28_23120 [Vibrio splendidus]
MNELAVVIPIYRGDNFLFIKEAVNSTLCFSENIADVIVVADGPLESDVINYLNQENIHLIQSAVNSGLPVALNIGIRFALERGYEFIARMDADDIVINDRFKKQLETLKSDLKVDFCSSNAEIIDSKGVHLKTTNFSAKLTVDSLLNKCTVIHPSVMFRRDFFYKYGFYDERLMKSQDLDLWLKAVSNSCVYHLNKEVLLKFRYDDNLVNRRVFEQSYNLSIKKKYINNIFQYRFLIKNYVVKYSPVFVLRFFLGLSK